LLAVLLLSGQRRQAWLFLTAWSLALAICLAVSPLAPARGTPPYVLEWIDVFHGARDGTMRTLSAQVLTGIITFPSVHAAGAVVLAWGASKARALRVPMAALNVLVVASAVLVGGHYIIDVVAGIAVAAAAIVAAKKLQPLFARSSTLNPA
jgi:membrane-associated phospholipid phosphatase